MIKRFLSLNGVAILGVILFHAAGWGTIALIDWADRYQAVPAEQVGTLSYYLLRMIEQLVVFCIPAFLFVSGFFIAFAAGRQKSLGWQVVGVRIRDMVIPYLVCSLILITVKAVIEGKTTTPLGYVEMLLTGGANPAYYYVPMMVQFFLLSPFLVRWAKASPVTLLVVAGVIQGLVQLEYFMGMIMPELRPYIIIFPKWFFIARIFWFSLGVVAGFNIKWLQTRLVSYKRPLLGLGLILIPLGIIEWELIQNRSGVVWLPHVETPLDSIYSLAIILAFLGYYQSKLPYAKTLDDLGSKSFGIYLVHSPVMEYTARAIAILLPALLAYQIIFFPLIAVVGLGVPLLLMSLMASSPVRQYYKYIFG